MSRTGFSGILFNGAYCIGACIFGTFWTCTFGTCTFGTGTFGIGTFGTWGAGLTRSIGSDTFSSDIFTIGAGTIGSGTHICAAVVSDGVACLAPINIGVTRAEVPVTLDLFVVPVCVSGVFGLDPGKFLLPQVPHLVLGRFPWCPVVEGRCGVDGD